MEIGGNGYFPHGVLGGAENGLRPSRLIFCLRLFYVLVFFALFRYSSSRGGELGNGDN